MNKLSLIIKSLTLAFTCLVLIILSLSSKEITLPNAADSGLSYQRQYKELMEKGYLGEWEFEHLEQLKRENLNSPEMNEQFKDSLSLKLYLAIVIALISYIGLKVSTVRALPLVLCAVVIPSLFTTSMLEAVFYSFFAYLGGVLVSRKNNKAKES